MKSTNKYLVVVAGPTAIGKTAVAIKIAQHFSTEILSADSRQFYKELNIGVARPSIAELATIKHHFIGHISINDTYTAGDFEKAALNKLEQLFQKHDIVVLAGGSGLFINALLNGLDNLPRDEKIRETLNTRQANEGIEALAKQLKTLDIDEYNSISLSNPRRIIRSLEICLASGEKASTLKKQNTLPRNFSSIKIALNTDRQLLYTKINNRVDIMLKNGLIDEVQHLLPYKHLNALQTVGYKELFEYFDGELDLEKAIELIKQHTRNYAKRQLTWFRKDDSYKWFEPQQLQDIVSYCKTLIQ